jgi:biopolymer transport protein ExbB/TolQ
MQPSATAPQHAPLISPRAIALASTIDRAIIWVGSPASLVFHTAVFVVFFSASIFGLVGWNLMLLILTTVVSLEAIYLAIFIQFAVNRQAASLKEVEENVEELGENVEEIGEHVEGLKEDVEEIQEDIGEINEDTAEELRKKKQAETLEALTRDVKTLLRHLESLQAE